VVKSYDTEPKFNFVSPPIVDGAFITFTRPLAPTGQIKWRDVSDLDSTVSISFAVSENEWPGYHSMRGVVKVQLSSTEAGSNLIFAGSMSSRSNLFVLHGVLMLVSL
jgi:hypothetical protein